MFDGMKQAKRYVDFEKSLGRFLRFERSYVSTSKGFRMNVVELVRIIVFKCKE